MWRYVIGLGIAGLVSAQILIAHLENKSKLAEAEPIAVNQTQQPTQNVATTTASNSFSYAGRKTKIDMDNRGHFVTRAKMNNRSVEVLVDTGATSVAINKSTARRLGIHLAKADFKYEVSTANGKTKAALAVIDRIQIGRVEVKNVRAAVLEDKALNSTLLGMTFLKELKAFEVRDKQLILTQ